MLCINSTAEDLQKKTLELIQKSYGDYSHKKANFSIIHYTSHHKTIAPIVVN